MGCDIMAKKTITLEESIPMEFTLDKQVYKNANSNFMIIRIYTDTLEMQPYLNPIYNNIKLK